MHFPPSFSNYLRPFLDGGLWPRILRNRVFAGGQRKNGQVWTRRLAPAAPPSVRSRPQCALPLQFSPCLLRLWVRGVAKVKVSHSPEAVLPWGEYYVRYCAYSTCMGVVPWTYTPSLQGSACVSEFQTDKWCGNCTWCTVSPIASTMSRPSLTCDQMSSRVPATVTSHSACVCGRGGGGHYFAMPRYCEAT